MRLRCRRGILVDVFILSICVVTFFFTAALISHDFPTVICRRCQATRPS